jgi:hypothetical protein
LQETIGTGTNLAAIINTYDPQTLQLRDQLVTRNVATPADVNELRTRQPGGASRSDLGAGRRWPLKYCW